MELNSKAIKSRVSGELLERLGDRWFDLGSRGLVISDEDNQTDFSIRIDVQADLRYGEYDCDLIVTHKWKRFRHEFREFLRWYQLKEGSAAKLQDQDFLYTPFTRILWESGLRRETLWVKDDQGVEAFVQRCIEGFNGAAGAWIRGWFTWPSALELMEDDQRLCGAWRESAYFWLLHQTRGPAAACAYLRQQQSRESPQFMESQVEYLLSKHCSE